MLKNYLKTAFRSLWRNKRYAILNITGLTLGITVCLVIYVIIQYEQSFDNFHTKKDRIYRVLTVMPGEDGKTNPTQAVPFPLPTALPNDFPEFEQVAGIIYMGKRLVTLENTKGESQKKAKQAVYFMPPSFFNIFDQTWLAGNKVSALNDPKSAVLTRSMAEKYFGKWESAMGKTLNLDQNFDLTVTGILDDPPLNTDFHYEMVVPYALLKINENKDWTTIDDIHSCYVLLKPGQNVANIDRQLIEFSKKYKDPKNKATQKLQPLSEVHTDKRMGNLTGRVVAPERIRMFWMIAGFILFIACVNFINLSTAQAVNRAREIGVRKVLGSNRWQLKVQFLAETAMLVLSSILLAVIVALIVLPMISRVMDLPLHGGMLIEYNVYTMLLVLFISVTFLAGFYPSVVVAGFNPVNALKSKIAATSKRTGGVSLRRSLVVFQFIIAQALIIGTLIILQQMNYFHKQSMGFSRDAIINVPFRNDSAGNAKIPYLRQQLEQIKGVQQVSFSNSAPSTADNWWTSFKYDHRAEDVKFAAITRWIDYNFINTYDIKLIAGRNVTATDSVREFLVNETLVKKMGLQPEDVLNRHMDVWGQIKGPIVGVVKDFAAGTLKEDMAPVFMANIKRRQNSAGVKLSAGADIQSSLQSIEKLWNANFPEQLFEYSFLDQKIADYYKEERQLSHLYEIFAAIAIFLSCLGLYGLASFMAVQRIKEVGVRKVLGATVANIVYLFSREFVILIAIAFVIAAPLVWYFMHNWLNNFVNRVDINWSVFVTGGLAALVIALLTVSSQAIRAAMMNPVKSLKTD